MAWDDTKSTGNSLTAAEWNAHVTDQKSRIANIVEDTTPQLGGNLDLNSNDITGTGNVNLTGTIDSTGAITTTASSGAAVLKAESNDTIGRLYLDGSSASGDVTQIRLDLDGVAQAYMGTRTTGVFYTYVNGADALTIDTSQNLTVPAGDVTISGDNSLIVNGGSGSNINAIELQENSANRGALELNGSNNQFIIKGVDSSDNYADVLTMTKGGGAGEVTVSVNQEVDFEKAIGSTAQTATGDGTTTIDWGEGNLFNFTFGAFNETFTFTAPSKPGTFILKLVQDSVGSRTATWPATVKWPGGTAPTLTTTPTTGTDIITFYYDGTNYFAVDALDFS